MGIPQIIYIVISAFGLLWCSYKHGKPRGEYNIWISLLAEAIVITLLIWGGFFK